MDLVYIFRYLYEKRFLLIIPTVVAAAVAYFLTINEKKYYRSTAQVSTGFTVSDEIQVGKSDFSFYEADTKFNNAIVTCTSPSVISLVSYNLILHDLEGNPFTILTNKEKESDIYKAINIDSAKKIFASKLESMSVLTSYKPDEKRLIEFLKLFRYDIKSLQQALGVYRLQRTDYLQIDYVSQNPELSAFVVNKLYAEFLRYYRKVRSTKAMESLDTLKSLLERKKYELTLKTGLQVDEAGIDPTVENTSKLAIVANLERMLTDEKNKLTNLRSTIEKVNTRLAGLNQNQSLQANNSNNSELLVLKKERDDTYSEYIRGGSKDQAIYQKYIDIKDKIQQLTMDVTAVPNEKASTVSRTELLQQITDANIDIKTTTNNIETIAARINHLKGNVIESASRSASSESLTKEVELANKEYLDAKQKYNDALDINTSAVNNFRQVLFGQPALDPEPSKRMLIVGMAGISTFLSITLFIIILTYLDTSLKTPRLFQKAVNLELISTINNMNLRGISIKDIIINKTVPIRNVSIEDTKAFKASLRKLRYEIEQSDKKIFLFVSTKKGQGKTTIIQALSYSLSLSKKKVLIIDTNFCNNDLTVQLNANPILETSEVADDNDSIMDLINSNATSDNEHIFVIGSEGGDYTPNEILSQQNLLKHLEFLKLHFDYIFLEGPPLNNFADSKELSQYVDGVIGIFSAEISINQMDKESIKFMKSLGDKFSGSVLNKVAIKNINAA